MYSYNSLYIYVIKVDISDAYYFITFVKNNQETSHTRGSDLTSYVLSSCLAGTNCLDVGELYVCVLIERQLIRNTKLILRETFKK